MDNHSAEVKKAADEKKLVDQIMALKEQVRPSPTQQQHTMKWNMLSHIAQPYQFARK